MAETMLVAFGRYLRTLRERRGYSLDDVASLTRLSPDPILKGYLSRCENGKTRIGFSKMNTLCQVYEVPLEVVAERHSLDMELERIGGPETKGKSFEELIASAAIALKQGKRWDAYGKMRDALVLAPQAPLRVSFRDAAEQVDCVSMNVATAAASLGKSRFAIHEFEYLSRSSGLGPTLRPVLTERLATRFFFEGDIPRAKELSDRSLREAEQSAPQPYMGYLYFTRALVAAREGDTSLAIQLYQSAFRLFADGERKPECANTLANLGQCYFDAKRYQSARRAIVSAERIAAEVGHQGVRVRVRILLGEIDLLQGRSDDATMRWREAVEIAKGLKDRVLHFKAEYRLWLLAFQCGDRAAATGFERRLRKLALWLPAHTDELQAFRRICEGADDGARRVAPLQRRAKSVRNSLGSHSLM